MEITNEMIYRKLEQMDERFARVDERFEQMDQRFEKVDERFAQMDQHFVKSDGRLQGLEMRMDTLTTIFGDFRGETIRRFVQIEAHQTEDHRILMNLWEHKDHMKLDLTRTLLTVTGTLSGVVAFVVSFFTGRAMIFKG